MQIDSDLLSVNCLRKIITIFKNLTRKFSTYDFKTTKSRSATRLLRPNPRFFVVQSHNLVTKKKTLHFFE